MTSLGSIGKFALGTSPNFETFHSETKFWPALTILNILTTLTKILVCAISIGGVYVGIT